MGDDDELMEELAVAAVDEGLANTFNVFPAAVAGLRKRPESGSVTRSSPPGLPGRHGRAP